MEQDLMVDDLRCFLKTFFFLTPFYTHIRSMAKGDSGYDSFYAGLSQTC